MTAWSREDRKTGSESDMRESVVMYVSTYSAILKRISSVEQREAIFEAIFNYAFYDEPIQEFGNPVADAIMDMVKPLIDSNNKNYVNGCKGGRPKKNETDEKEPPDKTTGKNHRIKPSGKGNVNVDKNVNENGNVDSHLHFTKDEDAPAPSADAGAAHSPFTLADVQQCVEENEIDLSDDGISAFYKWMEKYGWKINGRKITKLENALSGYAKKHPEYSICQAEAEREKAVKPEISQKEQDLKYSIIEKTSDYMANEIKVKCNSKGTLWTKCIPDYCPKDIFTDEELDYLAENYNAEWD